MLTINDVYNGKTENYILPFFWLHGETEEVLVNYIQKIHDSNIGAVCLESRPHPEFAGENWWRDLDIIIREAKRLNMKVWILDDSHFPTGYANGLLKKKYPERLKTLLTHRVVEILGPKKNVGVSSLNLLDETAKIISAYAKQGDKIINLKGKMHDEIMYFDIPDGVWRVYLIYESRKSDFNPDYINMVDKESCDVLIEAVYEAHYKRYKDEFGKTIAGFFSDEPAFMNEKGVKGDSAIGKVMPLPWSNEVKDRLKSKLGEDYELKLSSLWYEEEYSGEVRYAFMDICTQLYKENFSDNLGDWCRSHNVEYIGHVIEDRDSNARLGVGSGHIFRAMAGQDMAGVDVVLNQLIPGMDVGEHPTIRRKDWDCEFFHYFLAKMASSVGRIDPKKKGRTVAEVFGAYGWYEGVKMMKWIVDHFLIRGVNHFVPHAFSGKEFPDPDCPPHFYAHGNNPQFRYFGKLMEYLNKMATLLNESKTKPTAAVLYHAEAEWAGKYMLTQKPTKILTQNQIDFDVIPNDVFTFKDYFQTKLDDYFTVNGNEYKALIIPYCECITEELLKFIIEAKESKLKIVFLDSLPSKIINSNIEDVACKLDHVDVVQLRDLAEYMKSNNLFTVKSEKTEAYLRYSSFTKENIEYMMFFNEDTINVIDTKIKFETNKPVYKFDVLNNKITRVHYDGSIELVLHPYESFIYVLGEVDNSVISEETKVGTQIKVVDSHYKVSIANAFEYPNFNEVFSLEKLENLSLPKYLPNFSGTFRYETEVELDEDIDKAIIDLGSVHEIADLYINGECVGTRICPPYKFETVNLLKSGKNIICVDVTNTLDKQIMDFISSGEEIQPSGLVDYIKVIY